MLADLVANINPNKNKKVDHDQNVGTTYNFNHEHSQLQLRELLAEVGNIHYGRDSLCRRPADVTTAKCRGRWHLQLPAMELTVGTARPSAHRPADRRSPSAQIRPSAQLGVA
jgi:hypothetical protein